MNTEAIYKVVSQWYNTGSLPESDQPTILEAYAELTGITFTQCKKCQWADVQHALRYHLIKELQLPAMDNKNKWLIKTTLGFLAVHGLGFVYINKGSAPESDSAKFLTDEVAEDLIKKYPDLKGDSLVENPDYEPEAKTAKVTKPADSKPADTVPLTRQQKAAQTKAANKAKEDADEAEKVRLAALEAENANKGAEVAENQTNEPNQ